MAHQLPEGLYRVEAGYYYDAETEELLSLKSGELKPLKFRVHWFRRNGQVERVPGWQISVNGRQRCIAKDTLIKRVRAGEYPQHSVIPVNR